MAWNFGRGWQQANPDYRWRTQVHDYGTGNIVKGINRAIERKTAWDLKREQDEKEALNQQMEIATGMAQQGKKTEVRGAPPGFNEMLDVTAENVIEQKKRQAIKFEKDNIDLKELQTVKAEAAADKAYKFQKQAMETNNPADREAAKYWWNTASNIYEKVGEPFSKASLIDNKIRQRESMERAEKELSAIHGRLMNYAKNGFMDQDLLDKFQDRLAYYKDKTNNNDRLARWGAKIEDLQKANVAALQERMTTKARLKAKKEAGVPQSGSLTENAATERINELAGFDQKKFATLYSAYRKLVGEEGKSREAALSEITQKATGGMPQPNGTPPSTFEELRKKHNL